MTVTPTMQIPQTTSDRLDVRITSRKAQTAEIASFELRSVDGSELPAFEPGSHVDVFIGPELIRQYSLYNNPTDRSRYCLGVLLDPSSRGGSAGMHAMAVEGHVLQISRPRCNFHLVEGGAPVILAAGGIGITPMLSMAHVLHERGTPFVLHYCTRSAEKTAFTMELGAAPFFSAVRFHHDDGPASQRFSLDETLRGQSPDAQLYVCGPEGFIGHVTSGAQERGWQSDHVHVEHFKAEVAQDGEAFVVRAALSDVEVQVPAGVTIAQALMDAGVQVPLSCEQGICGSCLTPVLEGLPDHRDQYQTDAEKKANTHITLCCSRSCSARLVVEI